MAAPRHDLIRSLLGTLHETLACYDQPPEVLGRAYGPGKWTARELLVHLSDSEAVYADRLRRLAAEPNPTLQAFDENRWAAGLFYKTRDLLVAKAQYEAARRGVIELARVLPADADGRSGTHSEAGTLTFGQVLSRHAAHNVHHLEQLRACAAGKTWTKPA